MRTSIIPAVSKLEYLSGKLEGKTEPQKVKDDLLNEEEYIITIQDNTIVVKASTDAGFFYAEKTLDQIFFEYGDTIPNMRISDKPKYHYRSFMIDSCRHFFPVEDIKKMIDICTTLKFNKFHWHLTDDQGWRVQIDKYPELTTIGSVRKETNLGKEITSVPYGGFYTKEEIREVVEFACERFIEVVPEFEIPGHTSALLASLPGLCCGDKTVEIKTTQGVFKDILCAGSEKTYEVVFDIIDEMCELFPGKYFHIGGDEAPKDQWKNCEVCQTKMKQEELQNEDELQGYFVNRVSDYLKTKGKTPISWNESLKGGNLNTDGMIQFWMDKKGLSKKCENSVIVSDFYSYYVDYPYCMTPLKKTYNYEEKISSRVIGVDTPIWTEFIKNIKEMEYMCFPRYFAVAQSAWSENKPEYEVFEKDLIKLMGMYNTENWADKSKWNPNPVSRLGGTLRHLGVIANLDYRKKLIKNKLKRNN